MINSEKNYWAPDEDTPAGVSAADLHAWEEKFGVRLPDTLKDLLQIQNGGRLNNSLVYMSPLETIKFTDDMDLSAMFGEPAPEVIEPKLDIHRSATKCLIIAEEGTKPFALNYRDNPKATDPEVIDANCMGMFVEDTEKLYESFAAMLQHMTRDDGEPAFKWDEIMASEHLAHIRYFMNLDAIADELDAANLPFDIDYHAMMSGVTVFEWIVQKPAPEMESLVIFFRFTEQAKTSIFRFIVPEPLAKSSFKVKRDQLTGRYEMEIRSKSKVVTPLEIWMSYVNGTWQHVTETFGPKGDVELIANERDGLDALSDALYEFPLFG